MTYTLKGQSSCHVMPPTLVHAVWRLVDLWVVEIESRERFRRATSSSRVSAASTIRSSGPQKAAGAVQAVASRLGRRAGLIGPEGAVRKRLAHGTAVRRAVHCPEAVRVLWG